MSVRQSRVADYSTVFVGRVEWCGAGHLRLRAAENERPRDAQSRIIQALSCVRFVAAMPQFGDQSSTQVQMNTSELQTGGSSNGNELYFWSIAHSLEKQTKRAGGLVAVGVVKVIALCHRAHAVQNRPEAAI